MGLRLAWEMLHTYGFVPNNVPAYAGRPIFFEGVKESDPLARQKQATCLLRAYIRLNMLKYA